MRTVISTIICTLVISSAILAQTAKFVQPNRNGVGLYKNEIRSVNEEAVAKVNTEDRLKVVETKRNHYLVETASGDRGWVEKRVVVSTSGKQFVFDDAEVIGYLDNPTPVYIIDADSKDATPIKLDRSFADALRENVDRETVERQVK